MTNSTYTTEDYMKNKCVKLWKEVFGDSEDFILSFMEHHYSNSRMLCIERDGKLLSMLHLIPFTFKGSRIAYIYAVATDKEARGKGYATTLITQAIEKARKEGYKAVITLPADENLHIFYSRFGFKGKYAVKFKTPDNFDLGTGDASKDFACALLLDNSLKKLFEEGKTIILEK